MKTLDLGSNNGPLILLNLKDGFSILINLSCICTTAKKWISEIKTCLPQRFTKIGLLMFNNNLIAALFKVQQTKFDNSQLGFRKVFTA